MAPGPFLFLLLSQRERVSEYPYPAIQLGGVVVPAFGRQKLYGGGRPGDGDALDRERPSEERPVSPNETENAVDQRPSISSGRSVESGSDSVHLRLDPISQMRLAPAADPQLGPRQDSAGEADRPLVLLGIDDPNAPG